MSGRCFCRKPHVVGTLRDALSYPQTGETYSNECYEQVLRTCRSSILISKLDEVNHWQRLLSGGEQQRLAFARALLYRPQWPYMDESTSAMDEDTEAMVYQALIDQLPGLSIISVGHQQPCALSSTACADRRRATGCAVEGAGGQHARVLLPLSGS